jgi:hypothetical protein
VATLAGPSSGKLAKPLPDELDISTIQAIFTGCPPGAPFPPTPALCATHYLVHVLHAPEGAKLHYEWFIQLKLFDREGDPDPGTPGSGADFDPTCTNAELPDGKVVEGAAGQSGVVYSWEKSGDDFIWYHGDVGSYSDNLAYGCDHSKMGPDGHQGIVTLVVDDANPGATYTPWVCQSNYYGTNTGTGHEEDTDCHPESAEPGERFLVAVAWNDEITALHMYESKRNQAGAKAEIKHAIDDLKNALAKEKSYPFPDPYWVKKLQRAIDADEMVLKDGIGPGLLTPLHMAILDKDDLLDDAADDDGWAPPPRPLGFFPGR